MRGMEHVHPLKHYRETQSPKLSKAELARRLGVSRSYIGRIEDGDREPGPKLVPKISEETSIPKHKLRPDLWAEAAP